MDAPMSTASSQFPPASRYDDRFTLAPTQPLPILNPGPRRPFVVTSAWRRAQKIREVVRPDLASRFLPLWLGIFALLNLGDVLSTYIGLHNGMREGNPLMGALLAQYGFIALIGYKLLVVLVVTGGVLLLRSFHASVARVTIGICNVLVLLVVTLNVIQYMLS
jgi:hypothetical protein